MFIKKLLIFILAVLIFACLLIIPYVNIVDNSILNSDFLSDKVKEAGIYDSVYDVFTTRGQEEVIWFFNSNNLGKSTGIWFWNNISQVFDQNYVTSLAKQNVDASISYVLGESDELAAFDLMPKYEELKSVTEENLNMDIVMGVLPENQVSLLKFLGILEEGGEMNPQVKSIIIETIFESNDKIKEFFEISSTEELVTIGGIEDYRSKLDVYGAKIISFRKVKHYPLIIACVLSLVVLLLGLKTLKRSLVTLSITYFTGSAVTMSVGALIMSSKRIAAMAESFITERFPFSFNAQVILDTAKVIGKQVIIFGLYFLAISIVLFILSLFFKSKISGRHAKDAELLEI